MRKKAALEKIAELEKMLEQSSTKLSTLSVQYEKLLNDYRVCYTALESSQRRIKELADQNRDLEQENNTLKSHNAMLCEDNEQLRSSNKADEQVNVEEVSAETPDENSSHIIPHTMSNVVATEATKPKIELSYIEKYGSSVIGSVVVEATRVIGTLAGKSSPNARDALSLALGRAEILKSEVLAAVKDNNLTDEEKMNIIDTSRDQAMEYLAGVEAQN